MSEALENPGEMLQGNITVYLSPFVEMFHSVKEQQCASLLFHRYLNSSVVFGCLLLLKSYIIPL